MDGERLTRKDFAGVWRTRSEKVARRIELRSRFYSWQLVIRPTREPAAQQAGQHFDARIPERRRAKPRAPSRPSRAIVISLWGVLN